MALRLVIVGGGIAGYSACQAALAASTDSKVLLITHEMSSLYSPCVLPHYLGGEIPRDKVFLSGEYDFEDKRLEVITGAMVGSIEPANKFITLNHETIFYDQLVLALGGKAIIPPLAGIGLPGIFQFKTLSDADKLISWPARRAVVVGSGPIGVEVAAALRMRGMEVSLIEILDQLLPQLLDPLPAQIVANFLAEAGISILLGERVVGLVGKDRLAGVLTDRREIPAEVVIMATGIRPNIELPLKAGIAIGPLGGITTDNLLRTSDPNIWACGDCIESTDIITQLPALNMLWPNARHQGSIVGTNATGGIKRYTGSYSFVMVNFLKSFIFSVGLPSKFFPDSRIKDRKTAKGNIRLIFSKNRLVGAQIIGDDSWKGHIVSNIFNSPGRLPPQQDFSDGGARFRSAYFPKLVDLLKSSSN